MTWSMVTWAKLILAVTFVAAAFFVAPIADAATCQPEPPAAHALVDHDPAEGDHTGGKDHGICSHGHCHHTAAARTAVVLDALDDVLPASGADVVDIGGGTGGSAVRLAAAGHRVTVVDPSPDALAALARRAREAGGAAIQFTGAPYGPAQALNAGLITASTTAARSASTFRSPVSRSTAGRL